MKSEVLPRLDITSTMLFSDSLLITDSTTNDLKKSLKAAVVKMFLFPAISKANFCGSAIL